MTQEVPIPQPDLETCDSCECIEEAARRLIAQPNPYAFYFRTIQIQYRDGTLILRGELPTFYLKQMLQTCLRDIEGVERIDNEVDVISATGLSSICSK